jgi:MFS family permease
MNIHHRRGTGASLDSSESTGAGSRRVAFRAAGATLTLFLCGAGALSPLYAIYQAKFGFVSTVLTAILAVYSVAVLAAVRPAGELGSGRRPLIVSGLGLETAATALFLVANDAALVFAARSTARTGSAPSGCLNGSLRVRTPRHRRTGQADVVVPGWWREAGGPQ